LEDGVSSRTLFIGWDGADWSILDRLSSQDLMPHLRSLREEGSTGILRSTFPAHSIAAWTSFLSGLPSAEHGIVDFRRCRPGRYVPDVPYDSSSIRRPSLLEAISEAERRVLSINVPMTFPPFPVNGALVSGVFLPPGATFTHPPELEQELAGWDGFPVNGLEWAEADDLADLFEEAVVMTKQQTMIAERLIDKEQWDVALVAFMAPDRLQHAAMHLIDPAHPASSQHGEDAGSSLTKALHGVYQELDACLGRLIAKASPDRVILASDHGFRSVWQNVVPNRILEGLDVLTFRAGRSQLRRMTHPLRKRLSRTRLGGRAKGSLGVEATIDWSRTKAYNPSAPCQGIRLNIAGRDTQGIVPRSQVDSLLGELIQGLREWRLPTGDPGFSSVAAAEDVMGRPPTEPGLPDLYFEPGHGVALSGEGSTAVQLSGRRTGEHRPEGIIVTLGDDAPIPETIWELPHRILRNVGVEPWPRTGPEEPKKDDALTPQQESDIEDHLRGLGYVE
jgi:predicted AlkP superfamily phosphohydrolase/phosphomutase